jgi:hypothetical protein
MPGDLPRKPVEHHILTNNYRRSRHGPKPSEAAVWQTDLALPVVEVVEALKPLADGERLDPNVAGC